MKYGISFNGEQPKIWYEKEATVLGIIASNKCPSTTKVMTSYEPMVERSNTDDFIKIERQRNLIPLLEKMRSHFTCSTNIPMTDRNFVEFYYKRLRGNEPISKHSETHIHSMCDKYQINADDWNEI